MSIFVRIWLAFALVLMCGGFLLINTLQHQIKPNMRQVVEDTLADQAQVLAALVADDVIHGRLQDPAFHARIAHTLAQPMQAKIWQHTKTAVQTQFYITNQQGIVLYDSTGRHAGDDFSQWNDVYLTLHGQYGARSSKANPKDDNSSVMFVAAPIMNNDRVIGVVSVGKTGYSVQPYIEQAQQQMLIRALIMLSVSLVLCALVAWWLRHSINKVRRYAQALAPLDQPAPHFYSAHELNALVIALQQMREKIEDRAYVEHYVDTLTHELKSPITAIAASAELLSDDLPLADQQRFAKQISQQTERLSQLIERLLLLARLEKRHTDMNRQPIDVVSLLSVLIDQRQSLLEHKQLHLIKHLPEYAIAWLDSFWFAQALGNILDNAIDFSPPQGTITLTIEAYASNWLIRIHNQGSAIPDYALPHVFDRYYSLPRPQNGRKSTGIGLTLVKEVVDQHHGSIRIENINDGVEVSITLPHASFA